MKQYQYLIVGGGMTADSAVQGIRGIDQTSTIGLISAERDPPYDRPPLSKGLWTGDTVIDEVWRATLDYDVDLHLGRNVTTIDSVQKRLVDDSGDTYQYDKLLLATGGTPRRLPNDVPELVYYRTIQDYHKLIKAVECNRDFGVIGGGFIGSEIAAALTLKGKQVTMIFPEVGVGGLVFPSSLSHYLSSYYTEKGVKVRANELVTSINTVGNKIQVQTNKTRDLVFDFMIAGIGVIPNTELAENIGLDIGNGILVDQYLRTSNPDIFAAGDVANFENPQLGQRIRVEHEDNANRMGALVGKNMTGEMEPYNHLPSFYSDLFDIGYEAVGVLSAKFDTVVDWSEEFHEGIVYYLSEQRIRGILLWNVWEQVDAARDLIAQKGPFNSHNVIGLLPS